MRLLRTAAGSVALAVLVAAQAAAPRSPAFEVAVIRPSIPGSQGRSFGVRGSHYETVNIPVSDLIKIAYEIHARQIVGAPSWCQSEPYDIDAKLEDNDPHPAVPRLHQMLQALLAERLQLRFHRETRELAAYEIVPGKTGPKLTKSDAESGNLPAFNNGPGHMRARNANIADFARMMQWEVLDGPVVDHTGIAGRFDFELNWTPDETPRDDPNAPPELFAAMQEQLGLKVAAVKTAVEVLVIDRIERPSEN